MRGRNIMISDDDEPILMDFGSTIKYVALDWTSVLEGG
jgi:hypothetical protein